LCGTINNINLCKQTYGYIGIGSSSSIKYYSIASDNTNSKYTVFKSCTTDNIGELNTLGGLCLGSNTGALITDESSNADYIMSGIDNGNGSIFSDSTNSILIKSQTNSHVLNNLVDSKLFSFFFYFLK